mmetsp:Transcript_11002/g.36499  ORF Transcript_11002/g.36499 Transcript_11002/m.36499 type:complete len:178 (-) Transcript_11002:166-699(-)
MSLIGQKVLVTGLVTRPDLNYQVGQASSFDEEKGRYTVEMAGEQVSLRPANLQKAPFRAGGEASLADSKLHLEPHSKVRMRELSGRVDLNGLGGTILCWDEVKQRYGVQVEGTLETVMLRPVNLEEVRAPRAEKWSPEWRSAEADAHIEAKEREMMELEIAQGLKNPFGGLPIPPST